MPARSLLRHRRDRYAGLAIRLKASKLSNAQAQRQTIARDRERTLRLAERARRALATAMQRHQARVAHSGQLLAALSYRSVLARGFALVRDEQGLAVHAAAAIGPGAHLTIEFADGRVAATADADRPAVPHRKAGCQRAEGASAEARRQACRSGKLVLEYFHVQWLHPSRRPQDAGSSERENLLAMSICQGGCAVIRLHWARSRG